MRIDAHQHFWNVDLFEYAWMPPPPSDLRLNYLPDLLWRILKRNRFDGSVLVQANTTLEETHWLLDLAEANEFIRAVVGWVDLTAPSVGVTLTSGLCGHCTRPDEVLLTPTRDFIKDDNSNEGINI